MQQTRELQVGGHWMEVLPAMALQKGRSTSYFRLFLIASCRAGTVQVRNAQLEKEAGELRIENASLQEAADQAHVNAASGEQVKALSLAGSLP